MSGSPASILESNLAALAVHSPAAAERLHEIPPRRDIAFLTAASGDLTARVGSTTLHSTYDPRREARRLTATEVSDDSSACVVLGLGLGYYVEEILSSHPDLTVVVVEGDVSLVLAVFGARDLRGIVGSPQLRLLLGAAPEEVAAALEELELARLAVVSPASLRALDPEYYRRVEAAVRAAADRKQINLNTLARFGRLWVRNLLRNVARLASSPGISSLGGRFRGIPALVVAAGPSLDDTEPLLAELSRRMLVVAVDSSIGSSLRAGVRPDFVVTVDPQYWNTRYFDRLSSPGTILICEPSTHPVSQRSLQAPAFFTSSLFPLGRLIESFTGEKGKVGAGGSVATSAWDVARLFGSSPIYLAGLDLGFPGSRTHARGLYFEELMLSTAERLEPAESRIYRYLCEAGSIRVESTGGGVTRTDRRMLVYKWWFERQLALPGSPPTLTLSSGGVRIAGMGFREARSLLELPDVRADIDSRLARVRELRPPPEETRKARIGVSVALEKLLGELGEIAEAAGRGLEGTEALEHDIEGRTMPRGARRASIEAHLAALDAIDSSIVSSASREVVGFLMQPLIHDIVGSRGSADAIASSRSLYREILDSAALHRSLAQEALTALDSDT